VAIVKDEDPEVAPTGAADVCSADTIVAFVATTETFVPASTVATNFSASVESTELSAGTGNEAGVAIDDAVVFATVSSDTATVITAAFAGVATIVPIVMAATMARAIFLNEFIRYFSLLLFISDFLARILVYYSKLNLSR
jgi:hypothetical protein